MVDGAEKRGHPGGDAIGYEISSNPKKPHRDGAAQVDAFEQLDEARASLGHLGQIFWKRRNEFALSRRGVFDARQSTIRIIVATLAGQPARRFRQDTAHWNRN